MPKHKLIVIVLAGLLINWPIDVAYSIKGVSHAYLYCTVKKRYLIDELLTVRLFSQVKIQSISFSPECSNYSIWSNGKEVLNTSAHSVIKFRYCNDSIELKTVERVIGKFKHLIISSYAPARSFKLKLLDPDKKQRIYDGNLIVDVDAGYLKCINEIVLDHYVSGVVQAEAGRKSAQEFYKVQAILARTFALSHLQKHAAEGFGLCDYTHCQAYYGKATELAILQAVTDTKGKVVVDADLNLIEAAFHSNSGGQTVNSEDIWGRKLSYLRSVNDTFSTKMPNARWERKMAKEDWLSYLKIKHNYPIQDSSARSLAISFKQDYRKPYLETNHIRIPLKNVRTDLQLKSTFFSITPIGDSVLFKGRGFGHGVGMCQEGAMRMAKLGYKHLDVINFYYQNTQLIDLHKLNFFKDE